LISPIETSFFAFASDLLDEGIGTVLENVAGRAGAGGITIAAAYHHGRDIFPHNPAGKVRFLDGGAIFFRPDSRRYSDLRLQPRVSRLAAESDVLADLCREAAARSLNTRGWAVFLHNYALGEAHPECACQNVFGDALLTDLCPANPDVRAYVRALAGDIASKGVAAVVAESLHYHGLVHGFHHERYFIELGTLGRFLLGLCFCDSCRMSAEGRGVDVVQRLNLDLEAYRSIIGRQCRLSLIVRPMPPDCDAAENLAQKLAVAGEAGAVEVGFYHYGLMRLKSLDLVRAALG